MLNANDLIGTYTASELCHASARMVGGIMWGQLLSRDQIVSALMQLDGLLKDGKSPEATGELMLALAQRIAPEFDKIGWSAEILEPKWYGDKPEEIQSARVILSSWPIGNCEAQTAEWTSKAARFLHGEQWTPEVIRLRESKARPSLTINVIPILIDRAIVKGIEAGEERLSREEHVRLQTILTLRNMDAQRMYNYMASARAEMVQAQLDQMTRHIVVQKATETA